MGISVIAAEMNGKGEHHAPGVRSSANQDDCRFIEKLVLCLAETTPGGGSEYF